jgi:hypothetical protein
LHNSLELRQSLRIGLLLLSVLLLLLLIMGRCCTVNNHEAQYLEYDLSLVFARALLFTVLDFRVRQQVRHELDLHSAVRLYNVLKKIFIENEVPLCGSLFERILHERHCKRSARDCDLVEEKVEKQLEGFECELILHSSHQLCEAL